MKQKDMTKLTVGYQFRHMFLGHLSGLFLVDALWLIAFSWTLDKPIWKEVASALFTLLYFSMIYSSAGGFAKHDKKPYTSLEVNKVKGFMFGLMISVLNVLFIVMYALIWKIFGDGNVLTSGWAIGCNVVFMLWTLPYFGFMNATTGTITVYSAVIMAVLPVLATGFGYIATCKDFYFTDKFAGFVYVKKDKK
ncbi:MAG: hypothetical protein UH081_02845 [Clostridia bacterium]|nr:hypothetical protein [Clostridia bacterium]